MRFKSSSAGSGSVGPTERDGRSKMGRNAPEMADFCCEMGPRQGEPHHPRRGARRELRVDMQLAM
ncbi:UNVERIFIED_CONTAM: hypothetical protein Sangu_3089100 [Sesamum angustifolium]|uniref:Uncharacterized protein n=1 Tax=Sesamum angustifolium TaxID=2727405 RepID=A0AAW2K7G4_9LAMI